MTSTPRETPLTDAAWAATSIEPMSLLINARSVSRELESRVAELTEYAMHKVNCELTIDANSRFKTTGAECTCGLDDIFARLDGKEQPIAFCNDCGGRLDWKADRCLYPERHAG